MSAPGAHNLQSLTTLQVRVESSRETTYVFHLERLRTWPPRAVHVYLENRRTCLPRESLYVSTSRIVVRVYLENRRTCLPREQPRGRAGARDKVLPEAAEPQKGQSSDYRVTTLQCCQHCLIKNLKSHRKARDSSDKVTTLQCCQHCQNPRLVLNNPVYYRIVELLSPI